MGFHHIVIASLVLSSIAIVVNIVALAKPYWLTGFLTSREDIIFHMGLWQTCFEKTAMAFPSSCVSNLKNHIDYLEVVRILECMAIISGLTSLFVVSSMWLVAVGRNTPVRHSYMKISYWSAYFTALFILCSILTYGIKYARSLPNSYTLGYSYYMSAVSGFLYIFVGSLLLYGHKQIDRVPYTGI